MNLTGHQIESAEAVAAAALEDEVGGLIFLFLYVVDNNIARITTLIRCRGVPMVKLNYYLKAGPQSVLKFSCLRTWSLLSWDKVAIYQSFNTQRRARSVIESAAPIGPGLPSPSS